MSAMSSGFFLLLLNSTVLTRTKDQKEKKQR